MTSLRDAAQRALDALEYGQHTLKQVSENQWESRGELAMQALRVALAEPVQGAGVTLKPVLYAPRRLTDEEVEGVIKRQRQLNDLSGLNIDFKEPQPGTVNLDAYPGFCFYDPPKGTFFGEMEMVRWLVRNRDGDYWKAKYGDKS